MANASCWGIAEPAEAWWSARHQYPQHQLSALESLAMTAIGDQFGGPEQRGSFVHSMLNKAMNVAADIRDANYNDGTEAWINPIFILPGSVSKPDFECYKLGHFSRKQKGLVVMIAVPNPLPMAKI